MRALTWYAEGMAFTSSEPPAEDPPEHARPLVADYRASEARVGRAAVRDTPR
jgi:hypothetical protein